MKLFFNGLKPQFLRIHDKHIRAFESFTFQDTFGLPFTKPVSIDHIIYKSIEPLCQQKALWSVEFIYQENDNSFIFKNWFFKKLLKMNLDTTDTFNFINQVVHILFFLNLAPHNYCNFIFIIMIFTCNYYRFTISAEIKRHV